MKHPRLAVAAIVLAGVLVAFALVRRSSSGPSYEGQSAAQWVKVFRRSSLAEQEDARDVFRMLGDRAVPYLLSVLTRPHRMTLARSYAKLRSTLAQPLQRVLPSVSTEDTETPAAYDLLTTIRPSAAVLMRRLKPWLSSPEHPRYLQAIHLLGTVGEGGAEAVPYLVQALRSTNKYHRIFALQSLELFGVKARIAVPALIEALDDPATHIRAIRALGNIGLEAKQAVPNLEALLLTADRYVAAAALHKIDPEGNYLRLLIDAVADPRARTTAISELGELGPTAALAVDAIIEALKTEAGRDRGGGLQLLSVVDFLRKISPTNHAVIPILIEKLKEIEGQGRQSITAGSVGLNATGYLAADAKSDRLNIAARLVWFDPAEPHGMEAMLDTLHSDSDPGRRAFAAYVLRQAG
ncbi:MAG: HEAT repeat domain-containing protein, partial [Verrucomicrobiota bacterium]